MKIRDIYSISIDISMDRCTKKINFSVLCSYNQYRTYQKKCNFAQINYSYSGGKEDSVL